MKCADCQKDIISKGGKHRRCKECGIKHEKERKRIRAVEWWRAHNTPEYKKRKNAYAKKHRKAEPIKYNLAMARCYLRHLSEEDRDKLIEELRGENK